MTNGLISAVTPHNKGRGGGNHPKTGKTNIEAVPLKKVKPIPRFYHAPVTPPSSLSCELLHFFYIFSSYITQNAGEKTQMAEQGFRV